MLSLVLQEHLSNFIMTLLGSNVQGGVLVLSGGVHSGAVLEQQNNIVHIAQPGSDVQGSLLLLRDVGEGGGIMTIY